MELWIRSQDKECLMKVDRIDYDYSDHTHRIMANGYETLIGLYETKERAIEILNEIQGLMQLKIIYKPTVQEEHNTLYAYKNFVKVDDNIEIKELSTFVYQMPAE